MNRYSDRLDRVIAYMEEHLSRKLDIETLADISHFSKYHFSRLFTSYAGMSPYAYLTRIRLNKSLELLRETDQSILEISLLCGFETVSHFNAVFKKRYSMTPTEARKLRNIPQDLSTMQEEGNHRSRYAESDNNFLRRIWDMNVSIRELPEMEVAFVRHVGSYLETYRAWGKLGEWAGKRGLFPPEQWYIGISLDDPGATEEHDCRYDACITIPRAFAKDEDPSIQYQTLPGGRYGLYSFYDTIDKLAIAYQSLYGLWLPNSDFEPDDRHSLEFCMNNPAEDPEGKAKIDLYIPVAKRN